LLHEIGYLITTFNSELHDSDEDVTMTRAMRNRTVVAVSSHYHKRLPGGTQKCVKTIHSYTDSNHIHYKYKSSSATPIFRETYQQYHNLQSNLEKWCNNLWWRGVGGGSTF